MTISDSQSLQEELEQFQKEKEKIRMLVGQIGGSTSTRHDTIINSVFIAAIGILLLLDTLKHTLDVDLPLPPLLSLELGIFLISVKIIWMMYKQMKVEHFQFWILHSIEFRLNDLSKQVRHIIEKVE